MSDVQHYQLQDTGAEALAMVSLTEAATTHLLACLRTQPEAIGVRFSVKKTGCSGLSYQVDYVNCLDEEATCLPLADAFHLLIEKRSLPYLRGMIVDYVREDLGSKNLGARGLGRLVFKNPNEKGQCGCGESFTV